MLLQHQLVFGRKSVKSVTVFKPHVELESIRGLVCCLRWKTCLGRRGGVGRWGSEGVGRNVRALACPAFRGVGADSLLA